MILRTSVTPVLIKLSRECGPYDPPEGLHLNPIALAHVGNDLGREGSHLVALKSPLFHDETL